MQPVSDKKTNAPPGRGAPPYAVPPYNLAPIVSRPTSSVTSLGPVTGLRASSAPQTTIPFSSTPMASPESSIYRTSPPVRYSGPSSPPTSSSQTMQNTTAYPRTLVPQFPAIAQPVSPLRGPPLAGPLAIPSSGTLQPQVVTTVPMGFPPQTINQVPPQTINQVPPRDNMPHILTDSIISTPRPPAHQLYQAYSSIPPGGQVPRKTTALPFPASRPISQPPLATFPSTHSPAAESSIFHTHQGGLVPPLPPPTGAPIGFQSREQMQYPGGGPPAGSLLGLVEDFQSLTVGAIPGSLDSGVDFNSLPRPLDVDDEATFILRTYPFNCDPKFLRLTTYAVPNSQSLLSRWHLPFGAVVHPLAEVPDGEEVPIVNFGTTGVVRCRRCRTYINPYVVFTDAGRKWRCNLCSLLNDVPPEYFCSLDANGRRCDLDQRPELSKGSVEFVAPTEYMVRPPMPPSYFFLIDVSVSAVQSGLLEVIAKTIKACLDDLPGFPRTQIGFLTFDSNLHFYSLKSSLTQPQMMIVADLNDIFLPLPDDLLVNLSDSRNVVDALLDSFPSMFQGSTNVESAFGPALKAAYMIMSQLGGKLLVFQSTLPSLGIGRLRLRGNDPQIYGTDKEHTLRIAEDPFYKQMAAEFSKTQIAVDIYAFNDKYSDVASLGTLAKYTGGQVYHYPSFRAAIHQEKLRYELARGLTRETAWEGVMRIRCGKGVRFTTYHGHFMLRSTDLLALPAVDCDKAFAMQLSLEETLMTTQTVYFQVALLYTSSSGERRIRVHTAAAPVVADLSEMYRQADTGAIVSLLSRLAIENMLSNKLEDTRQLMQLKLVKSLREYRNLYAVQHRLGGRLIFPDSLKFLALYILALCKSVALRGGYADAPLDERCAAGYNIMILPIRRMLKLLYPGLLRLDEYLIKVDDSKEFLKQLPLSIRSLDPNGIYIYDDGFNFIIWFGRLLSLDFITSILGADSSFFPDLSKVSLNEHNKESSRKLMSILRQLREKDRSSYQLCHMVRQGDQPQEGILLLSRLVEDQTAGSSSYIDWILQIYRQSQSP